MNFSQGGADIETSKQNSSQNICPACGVASKPGSDFCLKCGRDLSARKNPPSSPKQRLLSNLPWLLSLCLVVFFILSQRAFLTKGNWTQYGVALIFLFFGFLVWIVGSAGFLIQLIRRKKKRVWFNIGFCAFAAMVIGTSVGIYVDPTSEEPLASTNTTEPANIPVSPNATVSPQPVTAANNTPVSTVPPSPVVTANNTPVSTVPPSPVVTANNTPVPSDPALARQSVPAAGGVITVSKPGDPLNGLQITVPNGAYPTPTTFVISSQDIGLTNKDLTVVSPLIEVENGGGIAAKPMRLKIPIKYGTDDFPMAFEVDAEGRNLEPIPTLEIDQNSITVEVYHFSGKMVLTVKGQYLRGQELLDLKNGFTTGFLPGLDDWAFRNGSTYITQGGNCAGMSMTALYYFHEIYGKGKGPALDGQYQGKIKTIHEDDREAWRLVSLIQREFDKAPAVLMTQDRPPVISTNLQGDEVTYKSFQTAMIITGQPQLIFMGGKDKKTGKRLDVGHAMIVYGFKDGLRVADPNDPGGTGHLIPYVNGKLGPYETDTDPHDKTVGTIYDTFYFVGKGGSFVSWSTVGAAWAKINDRSLGDTWYPEYNLRVTDDKEKTYPENLREVDKLTVDRSKVSITVSSPVALQMSVYRDGQWTRVVAPGDPAFDTKVPLDLKQGENLIGIYVAGFKGAGDEPLWTDFKWVTITSTIKGEAVYQITMDLTINADGLAERSYEKIVTKESMNVKVNFGEFRLSPNFPNGRLSTSTNGSAYQYNGIGEYYRHPSGPRFDPSWVLQTDTGGTFTNSGVPGGYATIPWRSVTGSQAGIVVGATQSSTLSLFFSGWRPQYGYLWGPHTMLNNVFENIFSKETVLNPAGETINVSGSFSKNFDTVGKQNYTYTGTLTLKLVRTE